MKNIPNILSCFRIVLIPFFVFLIVKNELFLAGLVLILSGITDLLDGFLARRYGWITQAGKVLDPAADKLTQVTVYIISLLLLPNYRIFFIIMLVKEFFMLVIGGYFVKKGIKITGSNYVGKVATTLFYVIMVALLFFPNVPKNLVYVLLTVVTAVSIAAALSYLPFLVKYHKEVKELKTENKSNH